MKKPPWDHRGVRRLQDWMKAWVEDELNKTSWKVEEEYAKAQSPENTERVKHWMFNTFGLQVEAAEHGNIEPLREAVAKQHPELVPFIHLPKRRRGMRFHKTNIKNVDKFHKVEGAVGDVKLIREIWKKNYGKKNRPKGDPVTAEAIAAELWNVDEEDIRRRMRKA